MSTHSAGGSWHVFEAMTPIPYCAHPQTSLAECTRELVTRRVTGCPVLGQDNQLVGLLTLTDVAVDACLFGNNGQERKVEEVMQRRVYTIEHSATLGRAAELFRRHRVHRLVVLQSNHVVGVLSVLDLMGPFHDHLGYSPHLL